MQRCFADKLAAWFAGEACTPHPAPRGGTDPVTYRRQMNMAIALAASKWMEFRAEDAVEAPARLHGWLGETAARAERRGAAARLEAVRLVAAWLDECAPAGTIA